MTLTALRALLESADYQALVLARGQAQAQGQPWWKQMEAISQAAAEHQAWEIGELMALLLETYPGLVRSVSLRVDIDGGDPGQRVANFRNYTHLNGEVCCHAEELNRDDREAMEAIDGLEVFDWIIDRLNEFPSAWISNHLDTLNRAFPTPVGSAAQAREGAAREAGWVEASVRALAMDQRLPSAQGGAGVPRM